LKNYHVIKLTLIAELFDHDRNITGAVASEVT